MAEILHPGDYTGKTLPRVPWKPESTDLHVNLIALEPGAEIAPHVNAMLDVVMTCLDGEGLIIIDGEEIPFTPGTVAFVPTGASRGVVAGDNGIKYTTCHRKRGGIMPSATRR